MPIDDARFRQAMGHFASGVTVVTTQHDRRLFGMTISSFASLSLDPALVLICVDTTLVTHAALLEAKQFVVNILTNQQEHLSRIFASREVDKFSGVAWHAGETGLPVLDGALVAIECRLHATLPGGDHTIFVGEVEHATFGEGAPLLYYQRGYHTLVPA